MYTEIILPRGAETQEPKRIIIHAMGEYIRYEGEILHAVNFLAMVKYEYRGKKRHGLSAHILGCPDGDIIRCRHDNQGAYHAAGYNEDSLGYEFLVPGIHDYDSFTEMIKTPYLTSLQYEAGVRFVRDEWHIKKGIVLMDRHSDVSPERKVDPGAGFPWEQFKREVGTAR